MPLIRSGQDSHIVAFGVGESANPFGQESNIERLLEDFAEAGLRQFFRGNLIFTGKTDDERRFQTYIFSEIGSDLYRFA